LPRRCRSNQYEFDDPHAPNGSYPNPAFPLGAYHGAEVQYVLGSIAGNQTATPAQRALSDAMMDYWIGFIASGNPGGAPAWRRFQRDRPEILSLAPGAIGYQSDFAKIHHCELWKSLAR
jgi:para-nitrobenzyl esterase